MNGIFLSAIISNTRANAILRPLGSYRIASYLRQHGYSIQVIDFVHLFENDKLLRLIRKFITSETKFIGFSMMINHTDPKLKSFYIKMVNLFSLLKREYPRLKFIIGGSTGFAWSQKFQNSSLFDYIVKGYGEDHTLALFNHYYKGTKHPPFEIIDGNKHLPEHLVIEKDFNFAQSRHVWSKQDCIQPNEPLPIEFARGCIFKCAFCHYPHIGKQKNDFTKHIECVEEELRYNYTMFGTDTYYVTDDTFNADTEFVKAFTDMSKRLPFKLNYAAFIRPDLLKANPETEDMFLENGLVSTYFGIETFQEDNAKMIGKGWSAKHGQKYLPYLYHEKWKRNIHINTGMIAGLPHENLDDLKKANQWFIDNQFPIWKWHALYLGRTASYYKSEFDLNAEKYGFSFKIFEGKSIWVNNSCNEITVMDWVNELDNDAKKYQGITSWTTIELSMYGLNFKETHKLRNSEIDWNYVTGKSHEFIENYYKDLLAL
jgi:radical SAM superfamily enzyme YgiQ (UPF0313 family)